MASVLNKDLKQLTGCNILITGGMGFIGSNLSRRLLELGAKVTVLDAALPEYGANEFNFSGIEHKMEFIKGDVRDFQLVRSVVSEKDCIFDLAAQANYLDSSQKPLLDLDGNCRSKLILLEACREKNPDVKIIFTSSRLVYGKIKKIPVKEDHPTNPLNMYGIHKLTAEKYFNHYFAKFGMRSAIARIPNPYGPRQQMKHSGYGIVGWMMRRALDDETLRIYGDGKQIRDYIYIDDLVDALLLMAAIEKTNGQIYNLGSNQGISFMEMVDTIIDLTGQGRQETVSWPDDYEKNETGDYLADIGKIQSAIGWEPVKRFDAGVEETIRFYRKNKRHYW